MAAGRGTSAKATGACLRIHRLETGATQETSATLFGMHPLDAFVFSDTTGLAHIEPVEIITRRRRVA